MPKKIIAVMVVGFVCILCLGLTTLKKPEISKEVRDLAWSTYIKATGLCILAEEGPFLASDFKLGRDVTELGNKGDTVFEVRFSHFAFAGQVSGLILVNPKTKQTLVVFPRPDKEIKASSLPSTKPAKPLTR